MVVSLAGKEGSERGLRRIEETEEQLEGLNKCIWDESAVCACLRSLNILRKAAVLLWLLEMDANDLTARGCECAKTTP